MNAWNEWTNSKKDKDKLTKPKQKKYEKGKRNNVLYECLSE